MCYQPSEVTVNCPIMITLMDNSLPVYRQKYNKKKWQRQMECYTNLITAN